MLASSGRAPCLVPRPLCSGTWRPGHHPTRDPYRHLTLVAPSLVAGCLLEELDGVLGDDHRLPVRSHLELLVDLRELVGVEPPRLQPTGTRDPQVPTAH